MTCEYACVVNSTWTVQSVGGEEKHLTTMLEDYREELNIKALNAIQLCLDEEVL